jgi:tRNA A37 N6-isopentenylltransferase MiaA
MMEKGIAATRQLAKRQITWMRKMQNLKLYDSCDSSLDHIASDVAATITCELAL